MTTIGAGWHSLVPGTGRRACLLCGEHFDTQMVADVSGDCPGNPQTEPSARYEVRDDNGDTLLWTDVWAHAAKHLRERGDSGDVYDWESHTVQLEQHRGVAIWDEVWTQGVCPACGEYSDHCQGHGEIGDPYGHAILVTHDLGLHLGCHPDADCDD